MSKFKLRRWSWNLLILWGKRRRGKRWMWRTWREKGAKLRWTMALLGTKMRRKEAFGRVTVRPILHLRQVRTRLPPIRTFLLPRPSALREAVEIVTNEKDIINIPQPLSFAFANLVSRGPCLPLLKAIPILRFPKTLLFSFHSKYIHLYLGRNISFVKALSHSEFAKIP